MDRIRPGSARLLERVLLGDGGIKTRHFAYPELAEVFSASPDDLAAVFEDQAPRLASRALEEALDRVGLGAFELDALFVCTCTGSLCPGVSSYVAELSGLPRDAYLQDLVGLGCGAAIPTLRSAHGFLAANPGAKIACIAVEVCSAAFYLDDDPGQLISLSLFGDGASASIWCGPEASGADEAKYELGGFDTVHFPEEREKIRFVQTNGYKKNQLSPEVPTLSADAVRLLWQRSEAEDTIPITHGGGRDVVNALEPVLGLQHGGLEASRKVLEIRGNLSSPSVLVALEDHLEALSSAPQPVWLSSFGAGFSAHSALLRPV